MLLVRPGLRPRALLYASVRPDHTPTWTHTRLGSKRSAEALEGMAAVSVDGGRAWPPHTKPRQPRRHRWCGGRLRARRARPRCPWTAAGPGRASRRRAERRSRRGRRAGGPPPTGTYSDPARRSGNRRPGTPATPQATPTRPPGHAKGAGTEVPAPHSATTSSRLRLNQAQPWRRRRIHRRRPPAAAAPRPAVPTRPSKPVRARRCARLVLGFVAGASGAT